MKKEIIIYHGSENIIEQPKYGYGKIYNDYGLGFYCTEYEELAKEWASSEQHGGYANKYKLDLSNLKILDLNSKEYTVLHWIAILLKNRPVTLDTQISITAKEYILNNFLVNTEGYDIIIGYRADDSYFSFARDFLQNSISVNQLKQVLKLGELGNQIVLKSKMAFDQLSFISYSEAPQQIYFPRRKNRDLLARHAYLSTKGDFQQFNADDILMIDIIRGGILENDPRLR